MKKLIHFGCSFAVGNGVPHFVSKLPGDVAPKIHMASKKDIENTYGFRPNKTYTCGNFLADKLNLEFKKIAENGASNEMIFRKLLETNLEDSFVLIGLTTHNRREALTTKRDNSHWHTWKIVGPDQKPHYKDIQFNPWGKEYKPAILEDGQIRTIIQIIYMQSFLQNNKVPYLIFNALHNDFDKPYTKEAKELLKKVDNKFFYELKGTWAETQHGWCIKQGLSVSENDEHPAINGHIAWGEKMLEQVKLIINAN